MENITTKKTINWTIKTVHDVDVKILSNGKFTLPVIKTENPSVEEIAANRDYIRLFPATGMGQVYLDHICAGEAYMPVELLDCIRI